MNVWPEGLVTPLLTPLQDDELDLDALRRLVERQVQAGVAAVVVGGGSGEHGALHLDERRRLTETVAEALDGRLPLIVQTGALATRDSVALGVHAASVGADGLMVASPFGEPISWPERVRFYQDVDAATELPIMLYNTPPSGLLTLAQVEELMELPNVDAIKDSSGDVIMLGDLLALAAERELAVYVGYDSLLTVAVRSGARGVLFGVGNVIPEELLATMRSCAMGDEDALRSSWPALRAFLRFMEDCSNYVALVKTGLALDGHDVGPVRAPYLMPGDDERAQLAAHLAAVRAAFPDLDRARSPR